MATPETETPLDIIFIMRAKDLVGISRKEDLEKHILNAANRVIRNAVTLEAYSFYWIGLAIKAEVLILPQGQENQIEIRSDLQSPNGVFAPIHLAAGFYTLLIRKGEVVVRSVFLDVQPCFGRQLRFRPSESGSLQAILVPRDTPWLLNRLAAVFWELDFQMELQTGGKMFFFNQLRIALNILVIPYDYASTLDSDLQFASQVLLLVADDQIASDIFLLQGANFMDLSAVKGLSNIPNCFVEYQTLGAPVQLIIDQLCTTPLDQKTSISAVAIRQEKGSDEDLLLQLLCVWLTRPPIPSKNQAVYLKFAYEAYSFLTFDMAQQFTTEILRSTLESTVHYVTQRSNQIEVFALCSERVAWLLSINFDAIATEYCALQAMQEILWDDIKDNGTGVADLLKPSQMHRRCNVMRKD